MDTKTVTIDKKLYSLGIPALETAEDMASKPDLHKSWAKGSYLCCQTNEHTVTLLDSETKTPLGTLDTESGKAVLTQDGMTLEIGYRPVLIPLNRKGTFDESLEGRTDVPVAQGGCLCIDREPVHLSALPAKVSEDSMLCDTKNMGSCLLWTLYHGLLLGNYILLTGTAKDILPFICREVSFS